MQKVTIVFGDDFAMHEWLDSLAVSPGSGELIINGHHATVTDEQYTDSLEQILVTTDEVVRMRKAGIQPGSVYSVKYKPLNTAIKGAEFASREEADRWGNWNYKGRTDIYEIIETRY